jgi:HD-like signal output (HDOD) protein
MCAVKRPLLRNRPSLLAVLTGMNRQAKLTRALEIQAAIGQILLQHWDPIGVRDVPEAQHEYDGYVGGVYQLLAAGASAEVVAEHLCAMQRHMMGFDQAQPADLLSVAEKLCHLSVRLEPE